MLYFNTNVGATLSSEASLILFRFALDFSRHFCWRRLTGPPQLRHPVCRPYQRPGFYKGSRLCEKQPRVEFCGVRGLGFGP